MKLAHILFSLFVLFLFLGGAFVQGGITKLHIDLNVEALVDEQVQLNVSYAISAPGVYGSFNVASFPISKMRFDRILLFDDPRYVDVYLSRCIHGLYDHLRAEFDLMNAEIEVSIVPFEPLLEVFSGSPATVVLAGGVPNGTEFALLALQWVERGGVLITLGNESIPFLARESNSGVDEEGFLGIRFYPLDFLGGECVTPSSVAEALDFKFTAPIMGIDVADVEHYGGRVIGYYYERDRVLVSAALFHIGDGALIAFSGPVSAPYLTSAEDVIATDIARIVVSQLQWISGPIVFESAEGRLGEISGVLHATFEDPQFVSVLAISTVGTTATYARHIVEVYAH
ncbi:MAG: hypothetical protein QHH00_05130 [Methanomassiliicoccales archaeon]|jgi:hypothetical protein|nr:hypothetical protein [Methanomassiliicoccales archaeon]